MDYCNSIVVMGGGEVIHGDTKSVLSRELIPPVSLTQRFLQLWWHMCTFAWKCVRDRNPSTCAAPRPSELHYLYSIAPNADISLPLKKKASGSLLNLSQDGLYIDN